MAAARTGRRRSTKLKGIEPLGNRADALYDLREKRLALQREADTLREKERLIIEQLLAEMKVQGLNAARGARATIARVSKTRFSVDDWDKTLAAIRRRKLWHLLERRVAQRACGELHEANKLPDGIGVIELDELSITKARR